MSTRAERLAAKVSYDDRVTKHHNSQNSSVVMVMWLVLAVVFLMVLL